MDHKEQHHEHHRKQREEHKKEHRQHEHEQGRKPALPVHPAWLLAVGVALTLIAVLIWTFAF